MKGFIEINDIDTGEHVIDIGMISEVKPRSGNSMIKITGRSKIYITEESCEEVLKLIENAQ